MRAPSTTYPVLIAVLVLATPTLGVDFNDGNYHEVILNDMDTAHLDVLVLPPAAVPDPALRLAAINQSIDAWASGVNALGAQWYVDGFSLDRYTLPYDTPPESALGDPEIIVVSAEYNPVILFGIGAGSDSVVCATLEEVVDYLLSLSDVESAAVAPPTLPDGFHQHAGSAWAVGTSSCEDETENVCLVINMNFALDPDGQFQMYDLNAHEVGHCLGIGHVGDALDFSAKTYPKTDIMSYEFDPDHVFCVSNLNVRALEGVYAKVLGQPSSTWLDSGDYVHMRPSQYTQVNCPNPPT